MDVDVWLSFVYSIHACCSIDKWTTIQTTVPHKLNTCTTYNLLCRCSNLWSAWFQFSRPQNAWELLFGLRLYARFTHPPRDSCVSLRSERNFRCMYGGKTSTIHLWLVLLPLKKSLMQKCRTVAEIKEQEHGTKIFHFCSNTNQWCNA